MSQFQMLSGAQQDKKPSNSIISEEEIPLENNNQLPQLSSSNSIHISKGSKNVFVQNFSGIKQLELKQQVQARHFDDAFCLCVLDNQYLAVGSTDATITIYNLKSNCKLVRKINYYYEPFLVLEPLRLYHKTLLLSTGYEQIINVWDYLSGKKIIDLESCGSEIIKLCDNLDKNLIVGCTQDGKIVLWSYTNKKIVDVLRIQSSLNKDKKQVFIQTLIEQEQSQQENQEEEIDEFHMDSEMDLESHGSIYSIQQICSDSYLVLQRGCISEIKIVKQIEHELPQESSINNKSSSLDIQQEDLEQEITQKQQTRRPSILIISSYSIQVVRQFEANSDATQFNIVPYKESKIITIGTKRGYIFLYDFATGEKIASNKAHSGSVNEILTIQTLENKYDNPFIISTSHEDRFLKIESLITGEAMTIEDDKIYCYYECMNSKMQFFKNKKNELFIAVICQRQESPYFSIFQVHMDYNDQSSSSSSSSLSQSSASQSTQEQQK